MDQYCKTVHTEALLVLRLARTVIFPAAMRYQGELALTAARMHDIGVEYKTVTLDEVTGYLRTLQDTVAELDATVRAVEERSERMQVATGYCNEVLPLMQKIRDAADALELRVPDDLWALPNYEEILFDK